MSIFLSPRKHGRTGNNLFQLAEAFHLSKLNPDIQLCNFELNELGLPSDFFMRVSDSMNLKFTAHSRAEAEQLILSNLNHKEDLLILLDYLNISPDLARSEEKFLRSLFNHRVTGRVNPAETIFNVRAGDIWKSYRNIRRPIHPDYYPLPLEFYKKAKEFFMGSVEIVSEAGAPDWYLRSVNKIMKPSKLHLNRDLKQDFEDFLSCKRLGLSVSTLSWIASLIGDAEFIHYPKLGILDPTRRGDLLFSPPKPAYIYEFEDHGWKGGSRSDKEWLIDSTVRVTSP